MVHHRLGSEIYRAVTRETKLHPRLVVEVLTHLNIKWHRDPTTPTKALCPTFHMHIINLKLMRIPCPASMLHVG